MTARTFAVFSNGMPSAHAAAAASAAARSLAQHGWQLRICGIHGIEAVFIRQLPSCTMLRSARDRPLPGPGEHRITRQQNDCLLRRIRDLRLHPQPFATPRHAAHYAKLLATLAGPRTEEPADLALLHDTRRIASGSLPFVQEAAARLPIPVIHIPSSDDRGRFLAELEACFRQPAQPRRNAA